MLIQLSELGDQLAAEKRRFCADVLKYLEETGRETRGRTYFGTKTCGNPRLVERVERGQAPGPDQMALVRKFMMDNPAIKDGSASAAE